MLSNYDLALALAELEADSSVHAGNSNLGGRWLRVALAAEQLAGASSSANANINGWMLRAAVALELLSGGNGDAENRTREGLLKRIVDALEIKAGSVYTGSLGYRFRTAALNAVYAGFTPLSLSPTAWYDPSDITTLFQDSAGTTPVTATGQPVGRMNDKSGNGKHLTQATGAARPLYTVAGALKYLLFDGVDDNLASANQPFGMSISEASVMIAAREVSRIGGGLISLADSTTLANWWRFIAPFSDGNYYFDVAGATAPNRLSSASPAVGTDVVYLVENSVANNRQLYTLDGSGGASDATGHTINSTGLPLVLGSVLGAAVATYQNARFSGAVLRVGGVFTAAEDAQLLTYLAAKQGRVL